MVRNLGNLPGVQLQQQSAGRTNIEMRGNASVFDTQVLPIKDYRTLSALGVNTFDSGLTGSVIDIERIEVVRGAGSALYGPNVGTGVVHFITKNPIDHPGTAVEVLGGELSTLTLSARHAGRNDAGTFGYKVNFRRSQGDEFTLDGSEGTFDSNGDFITQISKFKTQIVEPGINEDGYVDRFKT